MKLAKYMITALIITICTTEFVSTGPLIRNNRRQQAEQAQLIAAAMNDDAEDYDTTDDDDDVTVQSIGNTTQQAQAQSLLTTITMKLQNAWTYLKEQSRNAYNYACQALSINTKDA